MKRILFASIAYTILVIFMISCASQTPSITEAPSLNPSTSFTISTTTTGVAPIKTWTDFNGVNSSSSKSVNGLNLSLSLDSTTYKPGQDVLIIIDEYNPLTTDIKVPAQNYWAYNLTLGGCGTMGWFCGIGVLQGSYTAENISKGTQLPFWNYSYTTPCPTTTTQPNGYDFKPSSHNFWEMHLNGYWKGIPMASFVNFSPGVYTIVAGDEWGTSVFVHFTVTQ